MTKIIIHLLTEDVDKAPDLRLDFCHSLGVRTIKQLWTRFCLSFSRISAKLFSYKEVNFKVISYLWKLTALPAQNLNDNYLKNTPGGIPSKEKK